MFFMFDTTFGKQCYFWCEEVDFLFFKSQKIVFVDIT